MLNGKATPLIARANREVWDAIFRELMKYPATTMAVYNDLCDAEFIQDMKYSTAMWIWDEVMQTDVFRKYDMYTLFKPINR